MARAILASMAVAGLLCATTEAASQVAAETTYAHYILLYPSSTIETDFGGRCVRLTNKADGVLYLSAATSGLFDGSVKAYRDLLDVEDCTAK